VGRGREVGQAGVAADEVFAQAGVEPLLFTHLLERVGGGLFDQPDRTHRVAHAAQKGVVLEHRELRFVVIPCLLPPLLASTRLKLRDARPDERVARPQVMVEERERTVLGDGGEPEAQLGEVDGERVRVHTIDARLGDAPLPVGELGLAVDPDLLRRDAKLDEET
jgi:hypothetical protein